jgi:hypothetical protein
MVKRLRNESNAPTRSQPVSLAPLSFEDALKALVATPPMSQKPKRKPAANRRKGRPRQKAARL